MFYGNDEEHVSDPYKFIFKCCPVCMNPHPTIIYKGSYNEVLGCDECVTAEPILPELDED